MANYYKLKIYVRNLNKEPETPDSTSTFYIESSTATNVSKMLNVLPTGTDIQLILDSIEYDKGMYKPSSADIVVTATSTSSKNSEIVSKIRACFLNRSADISMSATDGISAADDYYLGQDFLVYSVQPHYEINSSDGLKIDIKLYSRDKLLTENKFSHCYLNSKLGVDIIAGSLAPDTVVSGTPVKGGRLGSLDIRYDIGSVQSANLQVLITEKKTEIIQPYRVQYNEDFHSFISRLSGRCGEFLFFEGGKLCLGLPPSLNKAYLLVDSTNIKSVRYPQMVKSPLSVKSFYRDYQKKDDSVSGSDLVFNEDSSYDEYFDVFDSKEKPTSFGKEMTIGPYVKLALKGLLPALASDLVMNGRKYLGIEGLLKFGVDIGLEVGTVASKVSYVNNDFKKNVFDNKSTNTYNFNNAEQTDSTKLSQFASIFDYQKLFSSFYSTVKSVEKDVRDNIIELEVAPNTVNCKLCLGNKVKLNDEKGPEYLVCRISGRAGWEDNPVREEGEPAKIFVEKQFIEIVPKQNITTKVGTKSIELKGIFMPPYEELNAPAVASAQMAVVEDAEDPRYLGRVRIKYPWQAQDEKASPWVRFISPMASKDAKMHFKLTKGDEVMVDYIGGNMERPYVVGALFNMDNRPDKYLFTPYNRVIASETGERIEISPGRYDKIITDLVPCVGYVTPFIPAVTKALTKKIDSSKMGEYLKGIHGKMTLSDTYGFWTIEGDTSGRSITIDSMLGKVTMSAFTGITISASSGDVTIEGKNINIMAGNNIKIESGLEIKSARQKNNTKLTTSSPGEIASEIVSDFAAELIAGKTDMSILRTIAEIILPPMEGTLKVKSNRYLNLEAGSGRSFDTASDPGGWFISKEDRMKIPAAASVLDLNNSVLNDLRSIKQLVDEKLNPLNSLYSEAHTKVDELKVFLDQNKEYVDNNLTFNLKNDLLDAAKDAYDPQKDFSSHITNVGNDVLKEFSFTSKASAAFNAIGTFWSNYNEKVNAECKINNHDLTSVYKERLKTSFPDDDFTTLISEEVIGKKKQQMRRALQQKYMSGTKTTKMVMTLDSVNVDDPVAWEEAVRTMFVKKMPSWDEKIRNKFASKGWSFVDYDKYQSESYIKNPQARGKILLSQSAGRSFELRSDGTLHGSNIIENAQNNPLLSLQRVLLDDDNWVA